MNDTLSTISEVLNDALSDVVFAAAPTPTCPASNFRERDFLVYSNLAMLIPIAYCLCNGIKKFSIELVVMFITMINSSFYHECDGLLVCSQHCYYAWKTAYTIDMSFSYHLIPTMVFYLIEFDLSLYKVVIHALVYLINLLFVIGFQPAYGTDTYFLIVACLSFFVCGCHLGYLWYKGKLYHEYKDHFNCWDAITAACLAVTGATFFFISSEDYWLYHSLWHLFIMTSLYFAFSIYDMNYCFLWFKKKKDACLKCAHNHRYAKAVLHPNVDSIV